MVRIDTDEVQIDERAGTLTRFRYLLADGARPRSRVRGAITAVRLADVTRCNKDYGDCDGRAVKPVDTSSSTLRSPS